VKFEAKKRCIKSRCLVGHIPKPWDRCHCEIFSQVWFLLSVTYQILIALTLSLTLIVTINLYIILNLSRS